MSKFTAWGKRQLTRYGPPELVAKAVSIPISFFTYREALESTGNPAAAAAIGGYVGSLTETLAYYTTIVTREVRKDAHEARAAGRPYGLRGVGFTLADLVAEFGPAETFDTLLTRPALIAAGQHTGHELGGDAGMIAGSTAGQLAADSIFYSWPVFYRETLKPWMLAKRQTSGENGE